MRVKNNSGQILLGVLLLVSAVSVVVLSIATRSITEIQVTNVEDESLRAFSAAEAGIESALINEVAVGESDTKELSVGVIPVGDPGEATYVAEVKAYPDDSTMYLYPDELKGNESATIWFINHDDTGAVIMGPAYTEGEMRICWGEKDGTPLSDSTTPAVVLTVAYVDLGTGLVEEATKTFDPIGGGASRTNGFSGGPFNPGGGNCQFDDENLRWGDVVDLNGLTNNGELIYARLELLYNEAKGHSVGFENPDAGGQVWPAQGKLIESTGTSGDATRKVEVYTLYSEYPSILHYAVYAGGGLQ